MEQKFNSVTAAKRAKRWVLLAVFILLVGTLVINFYMVVSTRSQICLRTDDLPIRKIGLVLGTDLMRADGSTNVHFLSRVEGALKAYSEKKVERLLISGSPNNKGYNEVIGIRDELLKKGIPESDIVLDFGGVRTLESVRRVRDVYRFQQVIIITDEFHAPRAIWLSRRFGIDAIAFCHGKEPIGYWFFRSRTREYLARVKAVGDLAFSGSSQN